MQQTVADPVYTLGYGEEMNRFQARFAQQESLNFLIPHLERGQRLLDVGCGAGHLSARLAEAVAPGEMRGIDIEPSQVNIAREVAAMSGGDNAVFQVADLLDLPFEDGSFDVVHLGGVLLHIPETERALAEVKRVLRHGGIVASRDLMVSACFVHPELGMMRRSLEAFEDLLAADDGNPQIAKDMKLHLRRAGFVDIDISASFETYHTPDELEFFHAIIKQWFLEGGIAYAAVQCGALSHNMMAEIARLLEEWRQDPGAIAGTAFGRAIAVKP